jgi:hypothetical protein
MTASHLTVRHVPDELAAALEREKLRRGTSLNQTVIELLQQSLGVSGTRSNGIRRLAGTWTAAQHREFLAGIACLEGIDPDLWK